MLFCRCGRIAHSAPPSTEAEPTCCKQHGRNKRTGQEELPQRRVILQLKGRNDPSLAYARLEPVKRSAKKSCASLAYKTQTHADVCANSSSLTQHSTQEDCMAQNVIYFERVFAAVVGTSTFPVVHGSRPPFFASNMARTRAPSTKNVYMIWNTCKKRKKRLMSVIVRLVSSFFQNAGITHSVVKHASELHESTLLEKALVAVPQHALHISVVPFVAPSGVPRGVP